MSLYRGISRPSNLHIGEQLYAGVATEEAWAKGVREHKLRELGLPLDAQTIKLLGEEKARELGLPLDAQTIKLLGEEEARELGLAPEAKPVSLGQKTPWLILAGGLLVLWMVSRGQPAEAEGSKTD